MFDWSDPQTYWLNMTNAGLGILTVACVAVVAAAVAADLLAKVRASAAQLGTAFSPHAIHTPELGLTMADGGEPIENADHTPEKKPEL